MNLRIDGRNIRFRIKEEELFSLLKGIALIEETKVDQGSFQFEIIPKEKIEILLPMSLAWQGNRMVLEISQKALEELHCRGRSRKGIRVKKDSVDICFEVDIFGDKYPKFSPDGRAKP